MLNVERCMFPNLLPKASRPVLHDGARAAPDLPPQTLSFPPEGERLCSAPGIFRRAAENSLRQNTSACNPATCFTRCAMRDSVFNGKWPQLEFGVGRVAE